MKPNIGGVRGGRVGNMDQNNFMESLDAALKSRAEIPQMIAAIVTENVTRSEFAAAEARLAALEAGNGQAELADPRIAELEAKMDALLAQLNPEPAEPKSAKPGKAGK